MFLCLKHILIYIYLSLYWYLSIYLDGRSKMISFLRTFFSPLFTHNKA